MYQITGCQIKAARVAVGLSRGDLAEKCGISHKRLGQIESHSVNTTLKTLDKIKRSLESAGVEFTYHEAEGKLGIRFPPCDAKATLSPNEKNNS